MQTDKLYWVDHSDTSVQVRRAYKARLSNRIKTQLIAVFVVNDGETMDDARRRAVDFINRARTEYEKD